MAKRIFDISFTIIAAILLIPIMILIAFIIRIKLGSPIFFKQTRPGLNVKLFEMYKFRSMTNEYDKKGKLLNDEARLTKFGSFLRSTSLDELPELWNVLKGDMSLVGPRPLLKEYIPYYSARQAKRHDMKPGVTGWAQVNGRNSISWKEKFEHDVWYVENWSFLLDIKILLITIKRVFMREGISPKNNKIMSRFDKN